MDETNPIRLMLKGEQRKEAMEMLRFICQGNLPAPIDGDAWPPGYVDGWNDCLLLCVEEVLREEIEDTYVITDKGRELLEKRNG